ncbi:hypothetical protein K501DRAFT_279121 [Backusella circina FSU 941]|nr:hypothetical protein K501DRAFT_279121 [Backusella circina FSU 941]
MRALFLVSTILPISVYADYAQTRYYQNCAPIDNTILCSGGIQGNGPDSSGNIFKIDLRSVGSSIETSQLSGVWTTLTPVNNGNNKNPGLETRHSSVIQSLNDGLRILISGTGANGVDGNLTLPTPSLQNETVELKFDPLSWSEVSNPLNAPSFDSNYIVRGQTATLGPKNLIYFLGGRFTNGANTVTSTAPSFQTPYIFDPQQSIWTPQVTLGGGADIPSNRYGHSATYLPNSHRIFIFGGARVSNGLNDDANFAFILDLDSNAYTKVNLSTSPSGMNSRYGHSAVLMNNSLFIMFGKSQAQLTNEIDMIDVSNSDPTAIKWSSVYPPVEKTAEGNGGKTSAGTIAGATVGSIVGVGIIAGAIFFFLRKKKANHENKERKFDDYSNIDYSHQATYETSPRPMRYTAEMPDMNEHESALPVYYDSKPEEDINAYNQENFLNPQHHPDDAATSSSNIKPDEAYNGNGANQFQKPNRYEL